MAERGLTDRLKNSLYSVILAGSLALGSIGCGGGGDSITPRPPPKSPPPQSLYQTLELINDIDIDYTATLENVSQADRERYHNNTLIDTLIINTPNYAQTLSNNKKGIWRFDLKATGVTPHEASIEVLNYLPDRNQAYIDSLETNINVCSEINLNFQPAFSDKNPEDNPVPINSVTSLDGRTQVSINNGYNLTISAIGVPGPYEVNVEFGSQGGGLENTVLTVNILAVPEQIAFASFREGDIFENIYKEIDKLI